MRYFKYLSPLFVVFLMSFNFGNPNSSNIRSTQYYYLETTQHNIEGDIYIYSSIISTHQDQWANSKSTAVASFEDKLHDKFPQSVFDVNIHCVKGAFRSHKEAENDRTSCMSKFEKSNTSFIELSLN